MSGKSRYRGSRGSGKGSKKLERQFERRAVRGVARKLVRDCQEEVEAMGAPGWMVLHVVEDEGPVVSVVSEPPIENATREEVELACLEFVDGFCKIEGCEGHVVYGRLVPRGGGAVSQNWGVIGSIGDGEESDPAGDRAAAVGQVLGFGCGVPH